MEASKETLRRALGAQRTAIDAAAVRFAGRQVAQRLARFAPYLAAECVMAYTAFGNEVPTAEVIDDALRRGKRVFLPSEPDEWFVALAPGGAGGPTGARLQAGAGPGVVLVPLLAWGVGGERLGRGGGWYDRVLPRLALPAIGLGYEFQRAHVPIEPWDVRLDYIVTESRLVECGGVLSG